MNHYNQLPHFPYGQGLMAKMRMLNEMTNSAFNMMVDSGNLANVPFGFYSPAMTGVLPEIAGIMPGRMIPVSDPRGIQMSKFTSDQSFFLSLIQQVQQFAERDGNVTDMTLGRNAERGATKTAKGTIALLQMGAVAFGRLASLMSCPYAEMLRSVHSDYKRHAPDTLLYRVTKNGRINYKTMERDVLGQDIDFEFVLNPNRQQIIQNLQIMFQLLTSIPYVAQNPKSVRALAKQLYDGSGQFNKNFNEIWPPDMVPQVQGPPPGQPGMPGQPGQPQPGPGSPAPPIPPPGMPKPNGGAAMPNESDLGAMIQ